MNIDCVMLSYTKDSAYRDMTQRCIDSLLNSTSRTVDIYLVETSSDSVEYSGCKLIIQPNVKFGYNKFLNIGFSHTKNPYILISNNDVIYHEQCLDILVDTLQQSSLTSVSPRCPEFSVHKAYTDATFSLGFQTSFQLCGWSLLLKKEMLDKIYPLDEAFEFEYQDNDMALHMQALGGHHALVGRAKATHLLNQSHRLLPSEEISEMNQRGISRLREKIK